MGETKWFTNVRDKIRTEWFIYTVIIGLIPVIMRFLAFLIYSERTCDILYNVADFIVFGLVLNITNIHKLENKTKLTETEKKWKTESIGISALLITFLGAILLIAYLREMPKTEIFSELFIKIIAFTFCLLSLLVSYSIYKQINAFKNE